MSCDTFTRLKYFSINDQLFVVGDDLATLKLLFLADAAAAAIWGVKKIRSDNHVPMVTIYKEELPPNPTFYAFL